MSEQENGKEPTLTVENPPTDGRPVEDASDDSPDGAIPSTTDTSAISADESVLAEPVESGPDADVEKPGAPTGDDGGQLAESENEEEDPFGKLRAEVAETKNELLRALAETENLRKRAERERADTGKYAITGFAREMLAVADNLRRAIESVPEEMRGEAALATLLDGIALTEKELLAVFDRHSIRKIDPLGEQFDHNFHQAMFEVPAEGSAGTVIKVVQTGYMIAERLLRPALVGVSAAPKEKGPGQHADTKA